MKKLIVILFAVMLIVPTSAYASTDNIVSGMGNKALRGAVNLVTGIVEVPAQIIKGFNNGFEPLGAHAVVSKPTGAVVGVFRGLAHAGGRMSWGLLELTSFWSANPENNEGVGIPLDAEYAWQWGEQYSVFEPTLGEGLKPIGHKLCHGLANTFLGIAEVPGQTLKGLDDADPITGFVRGVWYFLSREAYGIGNLVSILVPNPETNPGYAFNGERPWTVLSDQLSSKQVR